MLVPTKLTRNELLHVLGLLIDEIKADDSYEGNIEYSCLDERCEAHEFMVRASFRTGNLDGQGGITLIGEVTDGTTSDASTGHAETDAGAADG